MVISLPITDRRNFGDVTSIFQNSTHRMGLLCSDNAQNKALHQLFIDYIFSINYQHYPTQIFSENVMIYNFPLLLYIQF